MQCNAKCPLCDCGPGEGRDVLRLDWEHVVAVGNKLQIKPYGLGRTRDEATEASVDLMRELFQNKAHGKSGQAAVPEIASARFYWIHKQCIEELGNMFQSLKRKMASG